MCDMVLQPQSGSLCSRAVVRSRISPSLTRPDGKIRIIVLRPRVFSGSASIWNLRFSSVPPPSSIRAAHSRSFSAFSSARASARAVAMASDHDAIDRLLLAWPICLSAICRAFARSASARSLFCNTRLLIARSRREFGTSIWRAALGRASKPPAVRGRSLARRGTLFRPVGARRHAIILHGEFGDGADKASAPLADESSYRDARRFLDCYRLRSARE